MNCQKEGGALALCDIELQTQPAQTGMAFSQKHFPFIFKVLSRHLVVKKQKLNTLLQYLFKVDISKDPVSESGTRKAFTCNSPAKGWTAASWCDYLHELVPWSR